MSMFLKLLRDQRAATAVEYALILAMIFLAMVAAAQNLGSVTIGLWTHVTDKVVAKEKSTGL
jgi:pilus assembly protein Flp/PilA